jgi:DNA repair protein RadA/Sms
MGRCPDCGAWDALESYVEPKIPAEAPGALAAVVAGAEGGPAGARPLAEIETADVERLASGIDELDRVLGGGFVAGSVVMLGGDPGIGKSTLLLQAAARIAAPEGGSGRTVLYVTSEESAYQTRLRAERLLDAEAPGDRLLVLAETRLEVIVEQARVVRPALMVLDSIQMVFTGQVEGAPGSVAQLRRCCTELVRVAKVAGMPIALVGHVTKEGQLAGPKLLEHLVDTVLSFEGDAHHAHRVVRGVKNRFGTTLEVGLFEMTGRGLVEVGGTAALPDPAAAPRPGSVLCPVLHGTRCLMVEIQALTATGFLGSAKRKTSGLDGSRMAMLIAVLEQHGGLRLADQDVFASAVGGLRVVEPAADLALCLAIAGAHYRKRVPPGLAAVGEVGLGGEVRCPTGVEQRVREAARLGYRTIAVGTPRGPIRAPAPEAAADRLAVADLTAALSLLESA